MDSIINKIIDKCLNGEDQKFFLPQHKSEIGHWICENIQDDFYKGEFVDIAIDTMKSLYLCRSENAVLCVYYKLLYSLNELQWGISAYNEVVDMVSKYAKNGEKLYKLHYKNFNEKQLKFYNNILNEHKGFYENSKEQ